MNLEQFLLSQASTPRAPESSSEPPCNVNRLRSRRKSGPKLKANPSEKLVKRRHNNKCARVGGLISGILDEHDCTLDAVLKSPYGKKTLLPVGAPHQQQIMRELEQVKQNAEELLKVVGKFPPRGG